MKKRNASHRVTIVDVARQANASLGTVSRVINDDEHVAPDTRKRIQAVMQEMGYVANRQARSLKGSKTNVIGVLVPDLGTEYIGEIMRGIDAELALEHYDLMLYTTHRTASKEASYVTNLVQGVVDGLLLVLPRNPADYMGSLNQRNFPFVLIDHQGNGTNGPVVGATNWQGAYNATEYLIKNGHERIGFITGSMDLGCAIDRLAGYRSALRTHHLLEVPELIYEGSFIQPDGYNGATALLSLPNPPTAIFASNDDMAMGVLNAVRNLGLHVPEDISVIGFDNVPQSAMVFPPLTTVQQPLEQMGRVATQMLLRILKDPDRDFGRIELPTELIVRNSTSPIKNRAG